MYSMYYDGKQFFNFNKQKLRFLIATTSQVGVKWSSRKSTKSSGVSMTMKGVDKYKLIYVF